MSATMLETMKQQSSALTKQQQAELAQFLLKQMEQATAQAVKPSAPAGEVAAAKERRRLHAEWMKAHREEYAGQYVALAGDQLVGQGQTLAEAHAQARQNGVSRPFLVRLTSENERPFGSCKDALSIELRILGEL